MSLEKIDKLRVLPVLKIVDDLGREQAVHLGGCRDERDRRIGEGVEEDLEGRSGLDFGADQFTYSGTQIQRKYLASSAFAATGSAAPAVQPAESSSSGTSNMCVISSMFWSCCMLPGVFSQATTREGRGICSKA